jgi:hypothetical protein
MVEGLHSSVWWKEAQKLVVLDRETHGHLSFVVHDWRVIMGECCQRAISVCRIPVFIHPLLASAFPKGKDRQR